VTMSMLHEPTTTTDPPNNDAIPILQPATHHS
jgi:hypothetical protein